MFAVIKTGGKQYKVAAADVITIEKLPFAAGDEVAFSEVLLLNDGSSTHVGAPTVSGATVVGTVVEQMRGPKVIAFKKRRRQNSRRKRGHRQLLTTVRIDSFLTGGSKPSLKVSAPIAAAAAGLVSAGAAAAKGGMDTSNLSLISGIGPTIEKKLRAAGIQSWNDIASWSDADLAKWDGELALRGRAKREEWVEQANELLAGKPPRAKADQAELASGKDL